MSIFTDNLKTSWNSDLERIINESGLNDNMDSLRVAILENYMIETQLRTGLIVNEGKVLDKIRKGAGVAALGAAAVSGLLKGGQMVSDRNATNHFNDASATMTLANEKVKSKSNEYNKGRYDLLKHDADEDIDAGQEDEVKAKSRGKASQKALNVAGVSGGIAGGGQVLGAVKKTISDKKKEKKNNKSE